MPITSSRSPGYTQLLPSWLQTRGSRDLLRFDQFARTAHRTQGNTFTSLLKEMIEDTDEQLDKEIHRVRSGRARRTGASVPMELGASSSQCGCLYQPEALQPV